MPRQDRSLLSDRSAQPTELRLPAAVDPLLEVGAFGSERGVEAMTGEHEQVRRQREEPPVDRRDDLREARAFELRVPWSAREQRVAGEEQRVTLEQERRR